MGQNILVAAMAIAAFVVGVTAWWRENHDTKKTKHNLERTASEEKSSKRNTPQKASNKNVSGKNTEE